MYFKYEKNIVLQKNETKGKESEQKNQLENNEKTKDREYQKEAKNRIDV